MVAAWVVMEPTDGTAALVTRSCGADDVCASVVLLRSLCEVCDDLVASLALGIVLTFLVWAVLRVVPERLRPTGDAPVGTMVSGIVRSLLSFSA